MSSPLAVNQERNQRSKVCLKIFWCLSRRPALMLYHCVSPQKCILLWKHPQNNSEEKKAQEEENHSYPIKTWPKLQLQPLWLHLPILYRPHYPSMCGPPLLDLSFQKPCHSKDGDKYIYIERDRQTDRRIEIQTERERERELEGETITSLQKAITSFPLAVHVGVHVTP